ncbi:MAG: hypothetical protein FWD13_01350 [Treponema sp.]|nr:hypothetical protein [Treponema sp.]
MKTKFYFLSFILLALVISGCVQYQKELGIEQPVQQPPRMERAAAWSPASPEEAEDLPLLLRTLDELAELERTGSWVQGLALTESSIRERTGDYAGAVAAAYKELSWAFGLGLIQKDDLEQGLLNVLDVKGEESVTKAANAILAFLKEQWDEASSGLKLLFNELDEPDSFGRWLILVCALEKNREDRQAGAAYKSIRARYAQFPEYWYRGARAFSGAIAADFAENCINLSALGPYAQECRFILASYSGLKAEDGLSIKTKREIDLIISQSVNSTNPQLLDSLLPLIGLPDNPYTVYAVGALRTLTNVPVFRDYFTRQAASSRGRLAERLTYICRS